MTPKRLEGAGCCWGRTRRRPQVPWESFPLNSSKLLPIVSIARNQRLAHFAILEKKEPAVKQVNEKVLHTLDPPHVDVILRHVEACRDG